MSCDDIKCTDTDDTDRHIIIFKRGPATTRRSSVFNDEDIAVVAAVTNTN
jgi:hypothetical protein